MKKYLISFLIILSSTIAVAALTEQTEFTNIATRPSKNVEVQYEKATGSADYALATKHFQGDRIFATTNNTTKIFYKTANVGESMPTLTDLAAGYTDGQFETAWSAL